MTLLLPLLVFFFIAVRLIVAAHNRKTPQVSSVGAQGGLGHALNPVASPGSSDETLIHLDLIRLNAIQAKLGEQAIRYVLRGDNDSVLLTLKQKQSEITKALGRDFWSSGGAWTTGRSDYLLAAKTWRPDNVRRYADILDILHQSRTWPKMPGSDYSPNWLRALLYEYGLARQAVISRHVKWKTRPSDSAKTPWTISRLRELLGDNLAPILDLAFTRDDGYARRYSDHMSPEDMPGFEEHLRADPAARTRELSALGAKARAQGMRTFARLGLTDGPFFDFAFDQASDSAKSAREAAALALRGARPALLLDRTRGSWPNLKGAQKFELAGVIMGTCGEPGVALLKELADSEKNERVRADLRRRLNQDIVTPVQEDGRRDGPDGYTTLDGSWAPIAPAAALPEVKPISEPLRSLIQRAFELWRTEAIRHNDENEGKKYFYRQPVPGISDHEAFVRLLEGEPDSNRAPLGDAIFAPWNLSKDRAALREQILSHPDLTLWHLTRALDVKRNRGSEHVHNLAVFGATPLARAIRARFSDGQDLRAFIDVWTSLGGGSGDCLRSLLANHYWRPDLDSLGSSFLWPYFAQHFELFDEAFGFVPTDTAEPLVDANAIELLRLFPKAPARYMTALLERAVGDRKTVRRPARKILNDAPSLDTVLIPLLKHPKSDMRAGAAEWLGERGDKDVLKALIEAARKEQIPAAKASMLSAIASLGGNIREFVSADALLDEALAGLKKASEKSLEWFPFNGLAVVRKKDGTPLDAKVVRWWVVLAAKLKQPGGSPWFDLLLDELNPADAAKLGLAIMQAFVAYDTVAASEAEANAYAAANVDVTLKQYQRWQPNIAREQVFQMLRKTKLGQYLNSGNDQKGVLALCTRAPGADIVNIVKAYFRDHYTRTAQCKALIDCLAGNTSPLAIQFVLTIAKRWRTKGVQERAVELVQAIADRRGWTADELADRTVPSGGFDDTGMLELPIGERTYTARVDGQGRISLFNPDGKAVQGLPTAAPAGEEESFKDAKAALSTARKEVKQVYDFQSRRLYDALCVERQWPTTEWTEYVLQHPLVGRLAQRLIWSGFDDQGHRVASFRPLEDLTLTSASDEPVDATAFSFVRLAHSTALTSEQLEAWRAHLKDYEVAPLFDQLGRPTLVPADDKETEIVDRKGWMIEAFKLRGAATKLGYARGKAEDGGMFATYEKPFDALNLVAVLEFTGNSLPEENRPSALIALRFVKPGKGWLNWSQGLPLKDVPGVLISEAWNDLHAMAAAGTGFDAEWEKKAGW